MTDHIFEQFLTYARISLFYIQVLLIANTPGSEGGALQYEYEVARWRFKPTHNQLRILSVVNLIICLLKMSLGRWDTRVS